MRKLYSIAVAIFIFVSACTKIESTTIGSGLIPPVDGVTTIDTTLDVYTNNFIDPLAESLKVYKSDDHVIGTITDDPLFGKSIARTYLELKPTFYPFSFNNTYPVSADSAVLILSYKGTFGDTMIKQMWEVLELGNEAIKGDSAYTVSKTFLTGDVVGEKEIDITKLNDSVIYGFEVASNQIRIKLNRSFAQKLIENFKTDNQYKNDTTFRTSFKGFVVQPKSNSQGNALIKVNLLDTNTKLALFYNYKIPDSANTTKTVSYFRFSNGSGTPVSGSANYIKRDHSGSVLTQFNNRNNNDSVVFIQTAPGTFATVKIPGLRGFPNSIIHRAELLAYQAPDANSTTVFSPPRFILLSSYDSVKQVKTNVRNDFLINTAGTINLETFGGVLSKKTVSASEWVYAYTFDLTRYAQGIVTRKDSSFTLRLSAPSNDSLSYSEPYPSTITPKMFYISPTNANNVADGRIRLGGGGMSKGSPLRMRLRIIYSRI